MTLKAALRILLVPVLTGVFTACMLDEPTGTTARKREPGKTPETQCLGSPLCRVENPRDTTGLTTKQKEKLIEVIEAANDSAHVTITTVDIGSLADTSIRMETLKDLQAELLKDLGQDLGFEIDSAALAALPIDSLLATVQVTPLPVMDGTINLQWSGTLANLQVDKVSLNIKGDQFLGGFAMIQGKSFTFEPLGGDKIAIVSGGKVILELDECPPFPALPKATSSFLTCAF